MLSAQSRWYANGCRNITTSPPPISPHSFPPIFIDSPPTTLVNRTQQLRLQYIFPLLILLTLLIRLIVLPPHRLFALLARNIPHDMPSRSHIAFGTFALRGVDDGVEEVGFAVLAAEILSKGCQSVGGTMQAKWIESRTRRIGIDCREYIHER